MKVAVIGGGITGLAAAYTLSKNGHNVTLFEAEKSLGGLAWGFKQPDWDWYLEGAYHHWFTNDDAIKHLVAELGLQKKLIIKRPVTANLYDGKIYQLDSPSSLIRFPLLPLFDKSRTAGLLAFLKLNPLWHPLENLTAEQLLISIGGKRAYKTLWEPLLYGKFGDFAPTVSAAWFWARIKKRTPSLMYMEGGFHTLVAELANAIKGKIYTDKKLTALPKGFDKILLTVPTPVAEKLGVPGPHVPHLHAQTLILETDRPILEGVYWLNIMDRTFPFLAAVAHTNFMDKKFYGGRHLTYFGNYLPQGHPYLSMTDKQLLKIFLPFIHRLSHNLKFEILNLKLFTGPFAQPVHQLHYSQKIPPIQTNIPNVYLANMDYIVPWDRGTNYAVELGMQAAQEMMN